MGLTNRLKNKIYSHLHSLYNLYLNQRYKLIFLSEKDNWIIKNISQNLSRELNRQKLIPAAWSVSTKHLKNKIIHFSSAHVFATIRFKLNPSNKIIISWYHLNQRDLEKDLAKTISQNNLTVHTACSLTQKGLTENLNIPASLIKIIPLGIDLSLFPKTNQDKKYFRDKLGLPQDKIIIGSFQKDGNGWGEGLEPKLIKGPDIFCDTVEILAKKYPLHILLTGPARGYIKNRLSKANISFTHQYLNYKNISNYYHALDLYIIASRVEGGPMALLESWATGTPLVSTPVGMVPDISTNQKDILISQSPAPEELANLAEKIILNPQLAQNLSQNGLIKVKGFDWPQISRQYFNKLYKPLL